MVIAPRIYKIGNLIQENTPKFG